MITNGSITYYHKTLDNNKLPVWNRCIFEDVWHFGGKGSSINKGYENANDVDVRIPIVKGMTVKKINDMTVLELNKMLVKNIQGTNINLKVGDIIAIGIQSQISRQSDLNDIEYYNVTSINVNDFGNNPHIHLGGK